MRHLILFEAYKDPVGIGAGGYNKATEIDSNWILKMPKLPIKRSGNSLDRDSEYESRTAGLKEFKKHIKFFKDNPDICPEVKMLSPDRAALRRMDTEGAIKEINLLCNRYREILKVDLDDWGWITQEIYDDPVILKRFTNEARRRNDKIGGKWSDFLNLLRKRFWKDYPGPDDEPLDIHIDNFGLTPNGEIKLIDH